MSSPWLSLAISDAILAFSSLFGVFLMVQCRRMVGDHMPILASTLAYLLVGSAAALGTLRYGFSQSWAPAHDMLTAAALTLGPNLLATALGALCLGWKLSRPTWWRIMLGLMLGYEISRLAGYVTAYHMTINTLALIVMAKVAMDMYKKQRLFSGFTFIAVGAYALAALVVGTEGQLAGYLRLDLYHYLLALGHLFSASAIFNLLKIDSRS
ncbi:hypothetical protein M3P05_10950 [Sansalvadorimonas sp. 2012CJ34-2]|uniref:Uncharacterized protein n=1 Tax=Parendozoicomonas callyspongiae TaxID=2942213 RepID=A0ABT0PGD8_9GAMM|nr:hypothetical protein [Sansalvadorimonas sp. 2012CJ34-2]MCL6270438.1 hypothetical protein [Sansalvadorimonas sp. 2012CJ34-2]